MSKLPSDLSAVAAVAVDLGSLAFLHRSHAGLDSMFNPRTSVNYGDRCVNP